MAIVKPSDRVSVPDAERAGIRAMARSLARQAAENGWLLWDVQHELMHTFDKEAEAIDGTPPAHNPKVSVNA